MESLSVDKENPPIKQGGFWYYKRRMDNLVIIGFVGILGLIVGSFLNVLIYRLNTPHVPKFWQGRSFCPACKHPLAWFDNLPLVSFVLLRGKCRYCHKPISIQYPVVELTSALVGVFIFVLFPTISFIELLFYCFISFIFLVIFFSDLIYGLIPDEMVYLGVFITIIYSLATSSERLAASLIIAILVRFGFLVIVWLTKYRGMGLGDIKLGFLMGLVLGWPNILIAIWSGFIIGGAISMVLLALKRSKLSATIPLGPFLIAGTLVSALWTKNILALLLLN